MIYIKPEMEILEWQLMEDVITASSYIEGETELEDGTILAPPGDF